MARPHLVPAIAIAVGLALSGGTASAQPGPAAPAPDPAVAARIAAGDPVAGQILANTACGGCHTFDQGGATLVGPNLYGIVGAPIARTPGFDYSPAMAALGTAGGTWTYDLLDNFLTSPFLAVLGTRMGFAGMPNETDRANLIAWLRLQSAAPVPLPGAAVAAADPNAPQYQAYQADLGGTHYGNDTCADCHGPTGGGGPEGPPLKGPEFQAHWDGRSVWDLFSYTRRTMPPAGPGAYEDEEYARILAYILELNGIPDGPEPFRVDRAHLEALRFNF